MLKFCLLSFVLLCFDVIAKAQQYALSDYNVKWTTQSANSSESMPVGGGDIGLNVWVEKGEVFLYLGKTGAFDENNTLLKLGRVRLHLFPNPFEGQSFTQELQLEKGHAVITGEHAGIKANLLVWVDVFSPNLHIEVKSNKKIQVDAAYESWRFQDLFPVKKENNMNSWKWAPPMKVVTYKDSVHADEGKVVFFHQNRDSSVFDIVVKQQGMETVKSELFNPLQQLISGGIMQGSGFVFMGEKRGRYMDTDFNSWILRSRQNARKHLLQVTLNVDKAASSQTWERKTVALSRYDQSIADVKKTNEQWWSQFWSRSYIAIHSADPDKDRQAWSIGRNYQLFRFMLACNAYGQYPTKFNGGLFTYDPSTIDSSFTFTPDFRNWGGGTHTAQNQRLVYWPMLRSGDFDMMPSQFRFYQNILANAELRSKVYWGHGGASFTEQIENFGLPNPAEYNWKRPADFDPGMEYNAWLEYQWDTVLEFCMMMLELDSYDGQNIQAYIPFVESCLRFFDEHYQFLAKKLGSKTLNEKGNLVFYPGSSAETYKMAYNASTTVAALRAVTGRLLALEDKYLDSDRRAYFESFLAKLPALPIRELDGRKMLAPAEVWARVNNTEAPQLYGVYPWGFYGVGRPDLDVATNTYWYDPDVVRFRSHVGWKQDNIFAARLGLTEEAQRLILLKLADAERRFPTFWGPGFDWVPDHNWGGSGMIGLQEMLMHTVDDKIYLLPAWPKEWDVKFKLHAPRQTTIIGRWEDGKLLDLHVYPESRRKDVELMK